MVNGAKPFFVLALPRSRTTWLSRFLSYPPKRCGHDLIIECNSISDFEDLMRRNSGTVETGVVVGWERLVGRWPDSRYVAIRRPVDEVIDSFARNGITVDRHELYDRAAKLDAFCNRPGVMVRDFDQLDGKAVCREIFEHCLLRPFDEIWWQSLAGQNLQIDLHEQIRRNNERRHVFAKLRKEAACA